MACSVVSTWAKTPMTLVAAILVASPVLAGMPVLEGMRQDLLDLDDAERRQHADEAHEEEEEPRERPHDDGGVGDRRVVGAPGVGIEAVAEAGHDDVEALEPHADQD